MNFTVKKKEFRSKAFNLKFDFRKKFNFALN